MVLIYNSAMARVHRTRQHHVLVALVCLCGLMLTGCTTVHPSSSGPVSVVAAERQWGSIVAAIGGSEVRVVNLISSPTIDPHAFESSPADANAIAVANYVVENGLGYDPWISRLVAASGQHPLVANVGQRLGRSIGENPHRWYDPRDVEKMIGEIANDLSQLRPALTAQFHQNALRYRTITLASYHSKISWIRRHMAGTAVGASESMFSPLVAALGLNLVTPERFLVAVSQGGEPTAGDLSTITAQLATHGIVLYCENIQNITPAVAAQVRAANSAVPPIAVVTMTETPPTEQSFATWQTEQLGRLEAALIRSKP